jgi:hypothetical protein
MAQEVCSWITAKASKPVWAKMTPNITDIAHPARAALAAGCEGVSAINTITSVMGINLDTLRPEPSVEGYTTPGGYSCKAVKPIALAKVRGCTPAVKLQCVGFSSCWACLRRRLLRAAPWVLIMNTPSMITHHAQRAPARPRQAHRHGQGARWQCQQAPPWSLAGPQ